MPSIESLHTTWPKECGHPNAAPNYKTIGVNRELVSLHSCVKILLYQII